MPRTSHSHPLRIDALSAANGLVGLTLCPGKQGDSVFGDPWARDLDADLDAVADWGAAAVVTLIEEKEFERLGVGGLASGVRERGIDWHHLPIRDVDVPDEAAMEIWRTIAPKLHRILEGGGRVLVHCRGGLGRAGTVAALMLTERGLSASAAIDTVRFARPGAVETREQSQWIADQSGHRGLRGILLRASLLAGAIGDSLGAEIEFLSLTEIRARFPEGLRDLPPHQGLRGAITDDTQMTLFTAEGMIRAAVRGALKGICDPPSVIHHALLRWYRTQGGTPRIKTDVTGLIADPRLHVRRAPGNTCLSALAESPGLGAPARNDSKGCGTIMRVAPLALMAPRDDVHELAMKVSALTHGHPTGQLAAAAWAEMLADVAAGAGLEEVAREAMERYTLLENGEETAAALQSALTAPRDGHPETVEALGGGWTAEEALAIALYACLCAEDFEHGLRIAVTHGGDSDSTGAIAGNMLGLFDPAEVLVHPWASVVECGDIVTRLVRDQSALARKPHAADTMFEFYPCS